MLGLGSICFCVLGVHISWILEDSWLAYLQEETRISFGVVFGGELCQKSRVEHCPFLELC